MGNHNIPVECPTFSEMRASVELLQNNRENEKILGNIFGFLDGGRFSCAGYTSAKVENSHYEC